MLWYKTATDRSGSNAHSEDAQLIRSQVIVTTEVSIIIILCIRVCHIQRPYKSASVHSHLTMHKHIVIIFIYIYKHYYTEQLVYLQALWMALVTTAWVVAALCVAVTILLMVRTVQVKSLKSTYSTHCTLLSWVSKYKHMHIKTNINDINVTFIWSNISNNKMAIAQLVK